MFGLLDISNKLRTDEKKINNHITHFITGTKHVQKYSD